MEPLYLAHAGEAALALGMPFLVLLMVVIVLYDRAGSRRRRDAEAAEESTPAPAAAAPASPAADQETGRILAELARELVPSAHPQDGKRGLV